MLEVSSTTRQCSQSELTSLFHFLKFIIKLGDFFFSFIGLHNFFFFTYIHVYILPDIFIVKLKCSLPLSSKYWSLKLCINQNIETKTTTKPTLLG